MCVADETKNGREREGRGERERERERERGGKGREIKKDWTGTTTDKSTNTKFTWLHWITRLGNHGAIRSHLTILKVHYGIAYSQI